MGIVDRKERPSMKRGLSLVLAGGNKERGLANEGFVGQRRGRLCGVWESAPSAGSWPGYKC